MTNCRSMQRALATAAPDWACECEPSCDQDEPFSRAISRQRNGVNSTAEFPSVAHVYSSFKQCL